MRILENSERTLRIAEAPPDGLNATFVRAGLFFTIPIAAVLIFQLIADQRPQWGSIFGTLLSIWVLMGLVWLLAQFVFSGNEGYTFDREHGILAVRIKNKIHSYELRRIVDTEIERDATEGGVYRVLLHVTPDLKIPVPTAYSDDYQEHVRTEKAIREFLGLITHPEPLRVLDRDDDDDDEPARTDDRPCSYCGAENTPMEQYAQPPRCLRCLRIKNRYDNWPGFAMAIGGFGLPIACFAVFGRPEEIGILLSCLILFTMMPVGAIGSILVARWLLNPARFGLSSRA